MIFVISLFKQFLMTIHMEVGTVLSSEDAVIRKIDMVLLSLNFLNDELESVCFAVF